MKNLLIIAVALGVLYWLTRRFPAASSTAAAADGSKPAIRILEASGVRVPNPQTSRAKEPVRVDPCDNLATRVGILSRDDCMASSGRRHPFADTSGITNDPYFSGVHGPFTPITGPRGDTITNSMFPVARPRAGK